MGHWKEDFGVIITCSKFDYFFAKGTCASVRTFMPDVPICLLVDGDFDLGVLPSLFDTIVVKKSNIKNLFLKKNSFGWGLTKMIAFWESPFEYFLLIDSDTVVYGDMRLHANFDSYDLIVDVPQYTYSDKDITQFYFDVEKIHKFYPGFSYRAHPYVCTGVIYARRNVLDLEEYKQFHKIKSKDPEVFKCGEQGYLNVCFFSGKENGRLRLGSASFQYLIPDNSPEAAASRFPVPNFVDQTPMVLHWAGKDKPLLDTSEIMYIEPMTYFRKVFLEWSGVTDPTTQLNIMKKEDEERKAYISRSFRGRLLDRLKAFVVKR